MDIQFAIATAISWFANILTWLIFLRAILSWFPNGRSGFIFNLVSTFTEPFVSPIRRLLNRSPIGQGMMIDFSPILTLMAIRILAPILIQLVYSI